MNSLKIKRRAAHTKAIFKKYKQLFESVVLQKFEPTKRKQSLVMFIVMKTWRDPYLNNEKRNGILEMCGTENVALAGVSATGSKTGELVVSFSTITKFLPEWNDIFSTNLHLRRYRKEPFYTDSFVLNNCYKIKWSHICSLVMTRVFYTQQLAPTKQNRSFTFHVAKVNYGKSSTLDVFSSKRIDVLERWSSGLER